MVTCCRRIDEAVKSSFSAAVLVTSKTGKEVQERGAIEVWNVRK